MFYTFASSPTDEITFKINFDDKEHIVGFAKFPIMKICQIAKVRHSLEIEMIDKKKFETDKEICVLAIVQI